MSIQSSSNTETKHTHVPKKSDLTQGNIWKHIFTIATPAIVGNLFNSLYNWIDTFWGGKISIDALAAFSMTFPVFLLAIAVGQCFGAGGMVLVSNSLGAKKVSEARYYMKQVVLNAGFAGLSIMIITLTLGKYMLILLGAKDQVLIYGLQYLNTLAFGMPFLMLFFALNISLTSQGNTRFMRNVLIMNTFINLGLDPLLMYGVNFGGIQIIPKLGITGIALATVFVQFLGVIIAWNKIQSDKITHWKSEHSNTIEFPKFDWHATKNIIRYGTPTFLQIGMAAIGLSVVNFFLARLSDGTAVAAYGIGLRIEQLALVPTMGLGMALSALVGQNNGAGNYLRIKEIYKKTILASTVLWIGMMLPIAFFGVNIARIFTTDIKTAQITYFYLSFAFLTFMAYQFMGTSSGLLQGMKKPKPPILVLTARQLVFPWIFIPLFAYVIGWGIYGVFTSVVVCAWISAIILVCIATSTLRKKIKESEQKNKTVTTS